MLNEPSNSASQVLVNDFTIRLQEFLSLESEISTWTLTYCTAPVLTIAWILGRKSGEIDDLFRSHEGINPFLILFIALVNALYVLAIIVKSCNIDLNALYLTEIVAPRIRQTSSELSFYTWDSIPRD